MTNSIRVFLLAVLALALAACSQPEKEEDTSYTPPPDDTDTQVDTTPAPDVNDPGTWLNGDHPEFGSLMLERTIYFDFDRSEVKSQYRNILRAHGEFMSSFGDRYAMTLEGHADERGTREYNLGLGERRNTSVANFLSAQGAGSVDSVSYGEENPVCTQSSESCWERNRRVEIVYEER